MRSLNCTCKIKRLAVLLQFLLLLPLQLPVDAAAQAANQSNQKPVIRPAAADLSDKITTARNIVYGNGGGTPLLLDLYLPREHSNTSIPLVLYIHGGGWATGSKDNHPFVVQGLAARGFAVASINYRLSSQARFPAQLHDSKCAVRWLRAHATQYGIDASRIGVIGTSAGAHLAIMLGLTADQPQFEGDGGSAGISSAVQAVIDWSGPSDLTKRRPKTEDRVEALLGPDPTGDLARKASPLTYVHAGAPPFLVIFGDKDPLVPLEQGVRMKEALQKASVPVQMLVVNGGHVPMTRETMSAALRFLQETLKNP